MSSKKYWAAINDGLKEAMAEDAAVVLFGEDVAKAGGPFGATRGLLDLYGPGRVRDTPISEASLTGMAVGAAMTGLKPVVEIMFMDFMTLAMDQLVNQAAKMSYMSAGAYSVPLVIRTLCAAGRSTGPQHSQSLEGWLAAVPGIKVVTSSSPADAKGLLKAAIRDPNPVVVIENLELWTTAGEMPKGDDASCSIGSARVVNAGTDLTIVAWGRVVRRAEPAGQELEAAGISAEVLDLRSINPIDEHAFLTSLAKTGRLLVVQDAVAPASVGRDLLARASADAGLRVAPRLLAPPFAPVPYPPNLEAHYFPSTAGIVDAALRLMEAPAK